MSRTSVNSLDRALDQLVREAAQHQLQTALDQLLREAIEWSRRRRRGDSGGPSLESDLDRLIHEAHQQP